MREIADAGVQPPTTRSAVGRVARNTGAATIAQVANALTGYILLYLIASLLGRKGVGVLGVIMSIGLIGQMVATLGIYMYLPRIVAQHQERAESALGTALGITGVASLGVLALASALIVFGLVPPSDAPLAIVGSLAIIPGALAEVCEGFIAGHERIALTALSNVIEGLSRLAVMPILLLGLDWGLYAAAATWVMGRCIGLGVDLLLIRFRLGCRPRLPDLAAVRPMLATAMPLSGALILYLVFARADVPLLARLAGTDAAGLLVGGYRPVEMLSMIPASLIFALYPALSRELRKKGDQAQRVMERVLVLTMVVMVGATLGLVLESALITRILFPAALHAASSVLSIAAWSLIPATIDAATTALLLAQGRYKVALGPIVLGVVTLVGLNLLLDGRMGADGAAIARVAAQVLAAGSKMLLVIRFYSNPFVISRLTGIAVASAALALVLIAGANAPFMAIPLGAAAYLLMLAVLRVVRLADLAELRGGIAQSRNLKIAAGS